MNDTTIQMIAQAVIANTKVIQSLIEALPHEAKTAIAEAVTVSAPVPVAPAPAPVVQAAPVVAPVVQEVVQAAPAMPAPPTFVIPVAAPVVQVSVQGAAPFNDPKSLIDYVMASYKALGAAKGAGIQGVLTSLGYQNINDVKPDHYAALFSGVEALK